MSEQFVDEAQLAEVEALADGLVEDAESMFGGVDEAFEAAFGKVSAADVQNDVTSQISGVFEAA